MRYAAIVSITLFCALPALGAPIDRSGDDWVEVRSEDVNEKREVRPWTKLDPNLSSEAADPWGHRDERVGKLIHEQTQDGGPQSKDWWNQKREAEAEPVKPSPILNANSGAGALAVAHQPWKVDSDYSKQYGGPPNWWNHKREPEAEADPVVINPDKYPGFQGIPFGKPGLIPSQIPKMGPDNLKPITPGFPFPNLPRPLQGPSVPKLPPGDFKPNGQGWENNTQKPDGPGKDWNHKREAVPEPEAEPEAYKVQGNYNNPNGNMAPGFKGLPPPRYEPGVQSDFFRGQHRDDPQIMNANS